MTTNEINYVCSVIPLFFRYYVDQAVSPALSYRSMASEENTDEMDDDDQSFTRYYRPDKILSRV